MQSCREAVPRGTGRAWGTRNVLGPCQGSALRVREDEVSWRQAGVWECREKAAMGRAGAPALGQVGAGLGQRVGGALGPQGSHHELRAGLGLVWIGLGWFRLGWIGLV